MCRAGHVVTDTTSKDPVSFGAGQVRGGLPGAGEPQGQQPQPLVAVVAAPAKHRVPQVPRFRRPEAAGGYSTLTLLWGKKIFLTSLSASSFATCPSYGYSEH